MLTPEIQQKMRELGLTAPSVSREQIDAKIRDVSFTALPSGKTVVCEITLENGWTTRGDASVVSRENFNIDLAHQISYEEAYQKIPALEAYLLTERLYQEKKNA